MLVATLNLNHRTHAKKVPPHLLDALASLERAGECVSVKAGTVVEEISLDGKIPPDAIAVRFAKWEQEDAKGPVSGVTWRKNIASWKFHETGAWVNPLK